MFWPFQRGDRLYTSESDISMSQIWRIKTVPALKELKIFLTARDIDIQMNQKQLTIRHLWWFQIEKNPLISMVYTKIVQSNKS